MRLLCWEVCNRPLEAGIQGEHEVIVIPCFLYIDGRPLTVQSDLSAYKAAAYRLLGVQIAVATITAVLFYLFMGRVAAWSALIGGFAYIIPNAWFFRLVFRDSVQTSPAAIVGRLYVGEAVKLVLTGIVFAACFLLVKPLQVGALFMVYVMMILINLAGLAKLSI